MLGLNIGLRDSKSFLFYKVPKPLAIFHFLVVTIITIIITTVESRLLDSNIALNRTKFEVPGQALYTSIEKSLVSSNGNRVN